MPTSVWSLRDRTCPLFTLSPVSYKSEMKNKEKNTIRFSYDEDTMNNHKVFIKVWSIVLGAVYLVCSLFWGFVVMSIPFCFLFFIMLYLWIRRWESKNEKKEESMALRLIDSHLHEDVLRIYGENVTISSVGYYFFREEKDERNQYILAYLSNDKTLLYDVKLLPSNKENRRCLEIILDAKETEERKLVRKITPRFRPLLYLSPRNYFKVRMCVIYCIGFMVITIALIFTICFKWMALVGLLGYLVVMGLMSYFCHIMKWTSMSHFFSKRLNHIIIVMNYSVPAIYLTLVLFLSLGIGLGVPCAILLFFDEYTDLEIAKSVQYFVCLVLTSIILVHYDNYIHKYILTVLLKNDYIKRLNEHPFLEVALNISQGRNINFIIYLAYFLFLSWTTVARLQGFNPWFNSDFIAGATPAFLVHIAFTNMVIRLKEVDLKTDTMMKFMSRAYNIRVLELKDFNPKESGE